jgi:hypothetical protein
MTRNVCNLILSTGKQNFWVPLPLLFFKNSFYKQVHLKKPHADQLLDIMSQSGNHGPFPTHSMCTTHSEFYKTNLSQIAFLKKKIFMFPIVIRVKSSFHTILCRILPNLATFCSFSHLISPSSHGPSFIIKHIKFFKQECYV